ncbi:MAG: hypothetical protein FWB78_08820 [Treponema sp.]|nr:hypothetical protein [Treponema sp.]
MVASVREKIIDSPAQKQGLVPDFGRDLDEDSTSGAGVASGFGYIDGSGSGTDFNSGYGDGSGYGDNFGYNHGSGSGSLSSTGLGCGHANGIGTALGCGGGGDYEFCEAKA